MKLGSAIAACLFAPTALAATAFETFNPLLRYPKQHAQKRSSEVPPVVKRQTPTSPFLNANTTSEYHRQDLHVNQHQITSQAGFHATVSIPPILMAAFSYHY